MSLIDKTFIPLFAKALIAASLPAPIPFTKKS